MLKQDTPPWAVQMYLSVCFSGQGPIRPARPFVARHLMSFGKRSVAFESHGQV